MSCLGCDLCMNKNELHLQYIICYLHNQKFYKVTKQHNDKLMLSVQYKPINNALFTTKGSYTTS